MRQLRPLTPGDAAVDDRTLVARALEQDGVAFELIMRRHNRLLFRTLRSMLPDDADAEDALQDAWLSAHRGLATFRGDAQLSTWLVRIAINTALMRRRSAARAHAVVVPLRPHGDAAPEPADEAAPDAERMQMQADVRRMVEQRIDELPEVYRVVFVLRVLEERSVKETADVLGIPEVTVRSRQFRAKEMLREALARDVDVAVNDAFGFDGARCDRVVAYVFAHLESGAR